MNFYISDEKLDNIYKSNIFKRIFLFSQVNRKTSLNIECKQNLEFHNISVSNEEVIKRLKLVINSNLGKKKIILLIQEKMRKIKLLI